MWDNEDKLGVNAYHIKRENTGEGDQGHIPMHPHTSAVHTKLS